MKKTLALLSSTACLAALANAGMPDQEYGETYPNFQPQMQSPLTRAAVEDDLRMARRAGTTVSDGNGYDQSAFRMHSPMQQRWMGTDTMNTPTSGTAPGPAGGYEMSAPAQTPR